VLAVAVRDGVLDTLDEPARDVAGTIPATVLIGR
jgi:hypothetical protein